jgi:DNA (cytosine-5)-methyltransferase 1
MNDNESKLTYISLFSGCGGFDVGFKENGYTCLGAYDINPHVLNVHANNLNHPVFIHDLNNHNLPGNLPAEIDVVVSGSPCQGFSTIGKREINDPRNFLLLTGGEIAIKYKAKVFICENVLGSTSGEHKKYWSKLLGILHKNGYHSKMVKYNALDFGLPQLRRRIILYAWKSKKIQDFEFLIPQEPRVTLKKIFKNLDKTKNHNLDYIDTGSIDYKIASKIGPGQKLCNVRGGDRSVHSWHIPEVFGRVNRKEEEFLILLMKLRRQIRRREKGDADPVEKKILKTYFNSGTDQIISTLIEKGYIKEVNKKFIDLKNTFNGKYKRLDITSYSPTVDTRFGTYKNFLHPLENRALSVREAARIQGFSDDFSFFGPIQKQYEMIGNAVPPPLSCFIAKSVKEILMPKLK